MFRQRVHWLRATGDLQRQIRQTHGDDADAVLAQGLAGPSGSRAARTYHEAMTKNRGLRFRAADINLPESVLHAEETVYEVAVGAQRSDTFPLLIVTDQRVLHVMDRWRGWTVLEEAPAAQVAGAELEKRWLSGRLRVHVKDGDDITMKVAEIRRTEEVAGLLRHLAAGGAPPR